MYDTGILGAMLDLSSAVILEPTALFSEFRGAFTENFVACELISHGHEKLNYWTSANAAEVDFIIAGDGKIKPIEVKSGLNKNKPDMVYRLSPRNFIQSGNFTNLPLYAANILAAHE